VGAAFDLPIALGILAASGVLPHRDGREMTVVGGLSLDGGIPAMTGVLPIAVAARKTARPALIFPAPNLAEAGIVTDLPLYPVSSLTEAVRILSSSTPESVLAPPPAAPTESAIGEDLADVCGQLRGRRALEIAAAGAHHVLFSGSPGAGKTMLARRLPGLLPQLEFDEALLVTSIHSIAGLLPPGSGLVRARPFRARTIPVLTWRWSAGARHLVLERSVSRMRASCFSMNCRSSAGACLKRCDSRSKRASYMSRA
jgi:magnesium chelatase family protein